MDGSAEWDVGVEHLMVDQFVSTSDPSSQKAALGWGNLEEVEC